MAENLPPAHILEASIQDLARREELLTREYEENARTLASLLTEGADTQGVGEAADGAIVATVDADHRLVDLVLEPPALRLGSIQRLRDELMFAVNSAIDDLAEQRSATGADIDPDVVGALLDRMPEVTALLPEKLQEQLRTPPAPTTKPGPIDAPDWKLDA
ncbi:YbaB/EbfC family nucleoid-associated protein [Enemella sp. A6]|uniref:YbaB/EbfC family nucleoid-associated protein n=1 Tax=Enemella sp. A6 TaxID=3440152 RepID=UPI003EB7A78A